MIIFADLFMCNKYNISGRTELSSFQKGIF